MSHALIDDFKKKAVPVKQACCALGVSRSGYYSAAKASLVAPKVCSASVHLKAAFAASGRTYGSRRLCTALQSRGITIGRHRVRSLMRANQLRSVWRRKFIHTTDSKHTMPVAANVLDRRFARVLPNQAWVSDITYIRTRSGWLYLAAVLDLHSRKIVGWAMAPAMPAALVCAALQMAIVQRHPAPGLIVHSDRGTQYASSLHQALLAGHGLIGSMSRKGNCWDTQSKISLSAAFGVTRAGLASCLCVDLSADCSAHLGNAGPAASDLIGALFCTVSVLSFCMVW